MTGAEADYLDSIELFVTTFLEKRRLLRSLDTFSAAVSDDVRDAVEGEVWADLHLLAEAAADATGHKLARKA
jgi:hypothetical protein